MTQSVPAGEPLFEAFLNKHDDNTWREVLRALQPSIHEVDRTATEIWFHFFPLAFLRVFQQAQDPGQLARKLSLSGKYLLKDQIDSSHQFLYGHRYWPEVKLAVSELAASTNAPTTLKLELLIRETAEGVAMRLGVDPGLVTGITAVAFMTLQQVGAAAFKSAAVLQKQAENSPEQIVKDRARDDKQGFLSSLFSPDKIFSITFDELDPAAKFKLINTQHLTTAAANDKRAHHMRDPRCIIGEGPIPVECRTAACGTCWVGVLAGSEKLSEVTELEWRRIREFGYIDTEEPRPLIRLSCQAQAYGNVTIVIPPWNGIFGKFIRAEQRSIEEEPAGPAI